MDYLMIVGAAFLFSMQFLFTSRYEAETGGGWSSSLKFTLYSGIAGLAVLFIVNGFKLSFSVVSLALAALYAVVCIGCSYASIKAFQYGNMSVYSVYCMIGGMLLPFIYGVACGEDFTLMRLICCLLIALSVVLTIQKGDASQKAMRYYIMIFILNGLGGVICAYHQAQPTAVDNGSFMMLSRIVSIPVCGLLLLKRRDYKLNLKALFYSAGYSVLNNLGVLLQLTALLTLPSSVQFPLVTGGVIVFSTVFSFLRREKVTVKQVLAALVALTASVFMAL